MRDGSRRGQGGGSQGEGSKGAHATRLFLRVGFALWEAEALVGSNCLEAPVHTEWGGGASFWAGKARLRPDLV